LASPRQPAVQSSFSHRRAQFRASICRHGSIAGRSPQWVCANRPSRQHPGAFAGHCIHSIAQTDKVVEGITAKRANAMLGLTGDSFWQEESYDHLVRHEREFEKITQLH
jgi:hypothetical protein